MRAIEHDQIAVERGADHVVNVDGGTVPPARRRLGEGIVLPASSAL
jgi:hypothetical protein